MAETKGFDLSALMGEVAKTNAAGTDGKAQIEYIPAGLIDADPSNFYSTDGIEELAGNIELNGLQQPLYVRPSEGGRYTVVSGHRRRLAVLSIIEGGSAQFADGVPCIVDRRDIPEALQKLQLIMANSDTRKMTSADQNAQAVQIEDLLRELVDQGYEFPGRLRDWVAQLSGMSRTKLARLKVIRDGLERSIRRQYYDKGKLKEASAYELARLPADMQLAIVERHMSKKTPQNVKEGGLLYLWEDTIKGMARDLSWLESLACRKTAGGGLCCNAEGIMDHLWGKGYRDWNGACVSGKCCASCDRLATCTHVCARMSLKADKLKHEARAAKKEQREAVKLENDNRIARIERLWGRFGDALRRAGIKDKALRQDERFRLWGLLDQTIEDLEDGSCTETKPNTVSPFGYDIGIDAVDKLTAYADKLDCSLDYLLGRTNVAEVAKEAPRQTAGGFVRGLPKADGLYYCIFDLGDGGTYKQVALYDADLQTFHFPGSYARIDMTPIAYYPLPKEDET